MAESRRDLRDRSVEIAPACGQSTTLSVVAIGAAPNYQWYVGTSGVAGTTIKAQHVLDLRVALAAVYVAAGLPVPTYSDPDLPVGTTMKVAHIAELRANVIAVE